MDKRLEAFMERENEKFETLNSFLEDVCGKCFDMTLSKFAKLFYPEFTDPKYAGRIENQFLEYRMRFDMWFLTANLDKRTKLLEFVRPHLKLDRNKELTKNDDDDDDNNNDKCE